MVNNRPWFILGDFNVTRFLGEHSSGSSLVTSEMNEFNECKNQIEVEDIRSTGCHFTWTKSLKNPRCGTLKKLDRILVNDAVMNCIPQAHVIFLLYIISDHSPAILCIPGYIINKPKSFRFMNYISERGEFIPIVQKGRENQYVGCDMYCLLKKLKGLKKDLKQLNWINGDTFVRVNTLKQELKDIQIQIDSHPHDSAIKDKATKILLEYENAKHGEFLILQQK
ncbi:uncharacterized protein [Rutidosis leptorrhynchoides]|uniref:uncharacterized protein n=1 Tax=Rutidosis leptorrhynchoides TaxID=125765 RepID=UPI003A9949C0